MSVKQYVCCDRCADPIVEASDHALISVRASPEFRSLDLCAGCLRELLGWLDAQAGDGENSKR